jgi:hypothetical protein
LAYLGNQPSNNFVSLKRQVITGDGTTSYTLDHSVASVNDVAIFVNNVRQDPASYSISGTALTLGGTISSSDSCYVIFLGQALQTVTPATGTVTNAMLVNDTIDVAKVAQSLKNTPAFEAYLSSDQTNLPDDTDTKVEFDTERFDTDNAYDATTNFRFQPTVSGKYFCYANVKLQPNSAATTVTQFLSIYKNGVAYNRSDYDPPDNEDNGVSMYTFSILDLNGSSDYVEIFGRINASSSGTFRFDTGNGKSTYFGAYKLIGV